MASLERSFTRLKLELCHFWGNFVTGEMICTWIGTLRWPSRVNVWPFPAYEVLESKKKKKKRVQTVTVSIC